MNKEIEIRARACPECRGSGWLKKEVEPTKPETPSKVEEAKGFEGIWQAILENNALEAAQQPSEFVAAIKRLVKTVHEARDSEVEEMRKRVDQACKIADVFQDEIATLRSQLSSATEKLTALEKHDEEYAGHKLTCAMMKTGNPFDGCTCGFKPWKDQPAAIPSVASESVSPWISVKENLPKDGQEVLTVAPYNRDLMRVQTFFADTKEWSHYDPEVWMPLPEKPKECL